MSFEGIVERDFFYFGFFPNEPRLGSWFQGKDDFDYYFMWIVLYVV
jgi:hypothetical protein